MLDCLIIITQARNTRMLFLSFVMLFAALGFAGSSPSCYTGGTGSPPLCSTCGGNCTQSSCTCSDSVSCVPDAGSCSLNSSSCCLPNLSWNPHLACCTAEPYCTPACLADEVCKYVQQTAVCVANKTYYSSLNLSVNNTLTIVTCKSSNMTVSVGKNLLEFLQYKPSASTLLQTNCSGAIASILQGQRVYSLTVNIGNGICGNRVEKNATHLIYKNAINIPANTDNGLIMVGDLSIEFSCIYNLTMWTTLISVIKPVVDTQDLNSGGTGGDALTSLAAYSNPAYTEPLLQSQTEDLQIGTTLYFGMSTMFPDPDFVLRIDQCFATPTSDSSSSLKIQLIRGGCAIADGPDVQVEENGISKEVRFRISAFSFTDYNTVYIFCNARLCNKPSGNCSLCAESRDISEESKQFFVGPFTFTDIQENSAFSHKGVPFTLLVASLLGTWIQFISGF